MGKLTIEEAAAIYDGVPVSANGIRILQLQPGTGDEQIACNLQPVQLQGKRLDCEAVSYTWDHNEEHIVYVNDWPLPVNANAYFCLKRLRYPDRSRSLWIDEICVNQADKKDRSHAVRIFDQIFASAASVLVWLGREGDGSNQAMDYFPRLVEQLREARSVAQVTELAQNLRVLNHLFSRPWFARVWTLQEAVFADNITSILCGDREIPYSLLNEFSLKYQEDQDGLYANVAFDISTAGRASSDNPPRYVLAHTNAIAQLRKSREGRQPMDDVQTLLERLKSCGATHERDRFYTIWPLLPQDYLAELREPRYDNAFTDVDLFRNLAIEELIRNRNPKYLGAAGIWQQRTEILGILPSWAADWASQQRTHPLWHLDQDCFHKTGRRLYYPNDNSDIIPRISEDRTIITMRGKILGAVKGLAEPFSFPTSQTFESSAAGNPFQMMMSLMQSRQAQVDACANVIAQHQHDKHGQQHVHNDNPQACGINPTAALYRTLVVSLKKEGARSGNYVLGDTFIRGSGASYDEELKGLFNALKGVAGLSSFDFENTRTLLYLFLDIAKARRFFIADGFPNLRDQAGLCCIFGLGPREARSGDLVCVLSGCVTPFLIREVEDQSETPLGDHERTVHDSGKKYLVVGECYLDGLMDGQVMRMDEIPLRPIEFL